MKIETRDLGYYRGVKISAKYVDNHATEITFSIGQEDVGGYFTIDSFFNMKEGDILILGKNTIDKMYERKFEKTR